jgi:branched-chain amino acid transport system ATP-binding protein
MSDPVLEVHGLKAGYGGTRILHGVDFTVGRGEIVAIIGRNGAGKSTLMKALIGLLEASEGTILFEREDITTEPADARARRGIGYIPQGREIFPRLTVWENLVMGTGINQGRRDPCFDLVHRCFPILAERRGQRAGTMSGGEQQQLAIARALVGNPDLVLLDEPSEGIQPSMVRRIGEDINRLNGETGLTMLFVEQNIDLILSIARRCYVMDKGMVIDEVAPERLGNDTVVRRYLAV